MFVTAYEARFHSLSMYSLQLLLIQEEKIRRFVKGLNARLQLVTLQMVTLGKSLKEMVEHAKNVEDVKREFYIKSMEKKSKKGEGFSGSFTKRSVPLVAVSREYSGRLVQSDMQVSSGVHMGPISSHRGREDISTTFTSV